LNFQYRSELALRPAESEAAPQLPRQEEHPQAEAVRRDLKRLARLLLVPAELLAVLPVLRLQPEYPALPFQPDLHTGCTIRATPP
jgi:hypothetical protein